MANDLKTGENRRVRRPALPHGQTRLSWSGANASGVAKLGVPAEIARLISTDAVFEIKLTDDGVLFKYVDGQSGMALPKWMLSK